MAGAALLLALGLLPPLAAWTGIVNGTDVCLLLAGMMLLPEPARREAPFDWLAARAAKAAGGSRTRLFTLTYLVGAPRHPRELGGSAGALAGLMFVKTVGPVRSPG